MKEHLPFELPCAEENAVLETSRGSLVDSLIDLPTEDLKQMENIYRCEIPELQSVVKLYKTEEEKARKERRLNKFPKSLTQWRPEGGQMEPQCEVVLNAINGGLQFTAVMYPQHIIETKQHSRDCLYVSKQHPTKRPSIVYFPFPSSVESKDSGTKRFGVIEQIYKHSFASKEFMWSAVNLFKEEQFDSQCGLWWSENSTQQIILILLDKVSHPLTIATDNSTIWFLDVPTLND